MKLTKKFISMCLLLVFMVSITSANADAVSQLKTYNLPHGLGRLEAHVWVQTVGKNSGNTIQWDYQVAAKYVGNRKVNMIRIDWQGGASLRKSASIDVNAIGAISSVGVSSSWQNVKTPNRYWINSNGSKESSWRSNMIIAPRKDYRSSTRSMIAKARVNVNGSNQTFEINAGV
ncbi:MAG: hypothetical protein ACRCZK_02745 [Oscillospiraceae bacterium]